MQVSKTSVTILKPKQFSQFLRQQKEKKQLYEKYTGTQGAKTQSCLIEIDRTWEARGGKI